MNHSYFVYKIHLESSDGLEEALVVFILTLGVLQNYYKLLALFMHHLMKKYNKAQKISYLDMSLGANPNSSLKTRLNQEGSLKPTS